MPKLSLPNELTNDGYFCAYTLRYFINEHIIINKLSSNDDIAVKKEENIHLAMLMINRAISQGCFHFKYNKNEAIFIKACKELYNEIIKQKKNWDPTNPNCEYFKVQNQIALGEKKASFNYIVDPNIDRKLYDQMKKSYNKVNNDNNSTLNKMKAEMYKMFRERGFSDDQIEELFEISTNTPHLAEAKIKEMMNFNEHFAAPKYESDSEDDEKIDVDSFLEDLGLQ